MWPYDDHTWWVNAIHYATCPNMREVDCLSRPRSGVLSLEELNSHYGSALDALRHLEVGPGEAARYLFRHKALRKWRLAQPGLARQRRQEAIAGFLTRNASGHLTEPIPYPYSVWMREVLAEWLPVPADMSLVTGRFGPGACAERYTRAERLLRLADWEAQLWYHWPERPHPRCAEADHLRARLCAVPKQYDKDRLITVEPCYASFVQQAARQYILQSIHEGPLRGTCMDLGWTDGQSIQRRLALRASRKRNLATIDLSDASDRIGWTHVQQVFPPHILDWLWQARTPMISVDKSDADGAAASADVDLMIYAGMGNATTFAIETLFFAAVVYAVARAHGSKTFVSVFGDDVICHSDTAKTLCDLNFPFFVVNRSKSFLGDDHLRESCGIFAFRGADITVPKVDGYPNTWDGRGAVCDLHRRCLEGNFPFLHRLAYCIASEGQLVNWPVHLPGYPTLDNPWLAYELGYDQLPEVRWNPGLQRHEYRVPIRRPKYRSYPLDWKKARSMNAPRPEEWLPAVLLEQVSSSSCRLSAKAGGGCTAVRFLLEDTYDISPQWVAPLC